MKKHIKKYRLDFFTPARAISPSPPDSRRGILLLVILGLLTLFLFIGTAFVVSTNQFRLANRSYQQVGNEENLSATQHGFLDEVLNQLIRDTNNQNSVLRYHSLLRDLYGTEGFTATIVNVNWAGGALSTTGGQMIEFQLTAIRDMLGNPIQNDTVTGIDGKFNGLLVTFLGSGSVGPELNGRTTPIVSSYKIDPNNPLSNLIIRVLSPTLSDGSQLTSLASFADLDGTQIVVNGRPFNGTGVGYDPNVNTPGVQKLGMVETVNGTSRLLALMPNALFFDVTNDPNGGAVNSNYFGFTGFPIPLKLRPFDGQGGSDESYDAPDFQNMFLAWSPPSPGEKGNPSLTPYQLVDPWLDGILGFNPATNGNDDRPLVLPSFHRPAMLNFWANHSDFQANLGDPVTNSSLGLVANASLLRKIMLRPNWHDHPQFTGSNPEFAASNNDGDRLAHMIFGPWDVDNDRDGIRDSVWVDFGAPIIAGPDGKLVKPLAAILVLDMDGRLNVNAHGTRELAGIGNSTSPTGSLSGVAWNAAPRGQAFGPAEIILPQAIVNNRFDELLEGDNVSGVRFDGRYGGGPNHEPGIDDRFDLASQLKLQGYPTASVLPRSSFGTLPDLRARYAMGLNDLGQSITDFNATNSNFDRLTNDNPYELDLSAKGPRGTGTSIDNPFSLAELERILRAYDIDSPTLPPRLYQLLTDGSIPGIDEINNWRFMLTTDSYDLPEPGFQLPEWVKQSRTNLPTFKSAMGREPVNATFADLIEYRLRAGFSMSHTNGVLSPADQQTIRSQMAQLISPEMMAGLKLHLNRPLGNGRDDNDNGVVDEPGEFFDANTNGTYDPGEEPSGWLIDETRAGISPSPPTNDFEDSTFTKYHDSYDRNGDGIIDATEQGLNQPSNLNGLVNLHNYRRQLLARHLYVMAMAVVDPLPTNASAQDKQDRARRLAQWAINAVDFRDPDNIMTAFEYDVDPFDGWQVDGDLATISDWTGSDGNPNTNDDPGGVVWGAERPELVMTETLAWHDRRTEGGKGENPDPDEQDGSATSNKPGSVDDDKDRYDRSYDQRERPVGAAFIELYNPWSPAPGANADTHFVDNNGNDWGVNLAAVDRLTGNSPVWRMSVYQTRRVEGDPLNRIAGPDKDPDDLDNQNVPSTIDRSIYFAGFDPEARNATWDRDGVAFYNDLQNNAVPTVRPGRYMVVGAGKSTGAGEYLAEMGARTGSRTSNRGIMLNTPASPNATNAVSLRGANGTTVMDPANFPVESPADAALPPIPGVNRPSVADVAIIDQPRRFSVSEPASGYPDNWAGSRWNPTSGPNGQYEPAYIDIPLDDQRTNASGGGGIGAGAGRGRGGIGAPGDRKSRTSSFRDGETRLSLPGQGGGGGGIGGGGGGAPSDSEQARRTIPGFSWIYLQRLANPLLPWNPPTGQPGHRANEPINPYRTVDSMGINVTVFNGLRDMEELRTSADENPLQFRNNFAVDTFASVQRGRVNNPTDPALRLSDLQSRAASPRRRGGPTDPDAAPQTNQPAENLWNPEGIGISSNAVGGYFRNKAGNGFGAEGNPPANSHNFNGIPDHTLGFLNEPFRNPTPATPDPVRDRVVPEQPFPWIDWNNRPFANAGELMQVPMRRSSQLLQTFSFITSAGSTPEKYDGNVAEIKLSTTLEYILDGPFGHLLNYFRTKADSQNKSIAGLYRVLDLVEVPSRYVGTETWLTPSTFGNTAAPAPGPVTQSTDPRYQWQPPFNRIFSRREPGKVNLNTIAMKVPSNSARGGKAVWDAIYQGNTKRNGTGDAKAHVGPDDDDFFLARRGYWSDTTGPGTGSKVEDTALLNKDCPTLCGNPFRAADTGDLVPLTQMVRVSLDSTLLRSFNGTAGASPQAQGEPFCSTTSPQNYHNSFRNPYYRYAPVTRLKSMTTTRSNVFAVWITVGFFEVEELNDSDHAPILARYGSGAGTLVDARTDPLFARVYPDGYMFTKEAGSDTGQEVRVRQFAIVDRTIPVGFQPGANHNVKETIRLKREIE